MGRVNSMVEALVISNILLWLMVIALAAVVLALVRQVGILHERVAPAGALLGRDGPRVGEPAPQVTVADWSGAALTVGGPQADTVGTLLLFVSPTCPVCATILPIAQSIARAEGMMLLLASDGPRAEHEAFVRSYAITEHAYVLSTELGLAYHVAKLPYAVVIDSTGILRAKGLVNTREHLESLFEAMRQGVASIQDYVRRERQTRRVA